MLLLSRKESYGAFAKVRMTVKCEDMLKLTPKPETSKTEEQEE